MREFTSFPEGFLWGASTASHQVEGGNRWNDWWEFEAAGLVPHLSGDACRHYELYSDDFELAHSWGHNAHRLSLEWSRIEPEQGRWNPEALDHYALVIAALRTRRIEPIVTLHHFTNPAWFTRRGGWAQPDSEQLFHRFVERVMQHLAGSVRYWITVNEPTVYVKRAYIAGSWPPCRVRSWGDAARVLRNLCRAHRAAYATIHKYRVDAMVGIAHSAPYVEASNPLNPGDRLAAFLRNYVLNRFCFRLLAGGGRLPLDFVGLNYYSRERVRWTVRGLGLLFGVEDREQRVGEQRHYSSLGWEIHAPGLTAVLREFSRYCLPLLITENGIATNDETLRSNYLASHLRALADAVSAGIDVRGYFYWSLMDNFEWAEGYAARFGLAAVDFKTQQRTPRAVALQYAETCRSNAVAGQPLRER